MEERLFTLVVRDINGENIYADLFDDFYTARQVGDDFMRDPNVDNYDIYTDEPFDIGGIN